MSNWPDAASAAADSKVSRRRRSDSPRYAPKTEPGVMVCSAAPNSSAVTHSRQQPLVGHL